VPEIMPDGSPRDDVKDKAAWWTCEQGTCGFTGPHVGITDDGEYGCMGKSCGGLYNNPHVARSPCKLCGRHPATCPCSGIEFANFAEESSAPWRSKA